MQEAALKISVNDEIMVSGILQVPDNASAALVIAHGAGAGMMHPFMAAVAAKLSNRQVATLRYQFPYMERGSKRTDAPHLAQATVRAAVAEGRRRLPSLPLFVGGKSFGGRMSSRAQAEAPLTNARGLVFFGFPLHPVKKPSDQRAEHLAQIRIPMLFLQGTRDALADSELLHALVMRLGRRAKLIEIEGADHSFHVPKRSGRTDEEILESVLDDLAAWLTAKG